MPIKGNQKAQRFAPIDTLATKSSCQLRQEILRREAADVGVARDVKEAGLDRLVTRGCEHLLRALGYAVPVQHETAEAEPARS